MVDVLAKLLTDGDKLEWNRNVDKPTGKRSKCSTDAGKQWKCIKSGDFPPILAFVCTHSFYTCCRCWSCYYSVYRKIQNVNCSVQYRLWLAAKLIGSGWIQWMYRICIVCEQDLHPWVWVCVLHFFCSFVCSFVSLFPFCLIFQHVLLRFKSSVLHRSQMLFDRIHAWALFATILLLLLVEVEMVVLNANAYPQWWCYSIWQS